MVATVHNERVGTTEMGVLLVGPIPPPYSGPEVVTQNFMRLGRDYGITYFHVSTSNRSNASKGALSAANVLRATVQVIRFTYVALKKRHCAQIAHIPLAQNSTGVLRDIVLMTIALLLRYKVIAHFHGGQFDKFLSRCRFAWIVRLVLGRVDRLIVLDDRIVPQFGFMFPDKILVVPNTVSSEWIGQFAGVERHCSQPLKILFVGHLSVAKGFLDLIQALVLIKEICNFELYCAGEVIVSERNIAVPGIDLNDGFFRAERLIETGQIRSQVHFCGTVIGERKRELFAECDVLCLPSYSEGMPLVILEAMFAGMAVVASRVGAVINMVDESVLVDPGDVGALGQVFLNLTLEDLTRLGKENRSRANSFYHYTQVMERVRQTYDALWV